MSIAPRCASLFALAVVASVPACAGEDSEGGIDDVIVIGRVPCGVTGHWDDGLLDFTRYTNDERGHPVESVTTDDLGQEQYRSTTAWVRDQVQWRDYTGDLDSRTEYAYDDDGRLIRVVEVDRKPGSVDFSGTSDYGYRDGRLVTTDFVNADPMWPDTHSEITGNRTPRETRVQCRIDRPTDCDTDVYEQADSNPRHWTTGTRDEASDGDIDVTYQRSLDAHGLELSYVETEVGGAAPVVVTRYTTTREPDGTELREVIELFFDDGEPLDTLTTENVFDCSAFPPVNTAPRPRARGPSLECGSRACVRAAVERARLQRRGPVVDIAAR